jgi:arylesterase/paraoxonase
MTWLKRIGIGLLAMIVLVSIVVVDFLRHGGQFRRLEPAFAASCETQPLEASAEDVQIDRTRGVAYLSILDRRGLIEGRAVTGTVMLLDLNVPQARPRAALLADPPAFRPHGLSLYRAGDGALRLFAINHPAGGGHTVEIFEQGPTGAFAAARSVRDALLVDPNAIVAVGPNQFYVANDTGARNGFERATELLFRRGLSTVVYFDGRTMRVAASGLKAASGIAISRDGARVYVSETSGNRIAVFARNAATGELRPLGHVELGSAPDNINVDGDGRIWVAAHAKILSLVRHFADTTQPAPTQIFRLEDRADPAQIRPEQVYLNLGEQISAGSVGAAFGGELLIGSITERKLLRCRLP